MSTLKRVKLVAFLCVLSFALGACGARTEPTTSTTAPMTPRQQPLRVVTTTTQLGDFARVILGGKGTVTTLVGPGGNPHDHALTPGDVTAIAVADVVMINGAGLDTWLSDLYPTLDHKSALVDASTGIRLRTTSQIEAGHTDPHYWMDPTNAKIMVATITDALVRADESQRANFEANSRAYSAQLQRLADGMRSSLSGTNREPILVSHDALGYFAQATGLNIVGSLTPGFDRRDEQNADHFNQTIEATKQSSKCIIVVVDDIALDRAREARSLLNNAVVIDSESLVVDSLGEVGSGTETYLDAMQHNVDVLSSALRGS